MNADPLRFPSIDPEPTLTDIPAREAITVRMEAGGFRAGARRPVQLGARVADPIRFQRACGDEPEAPSRLFPALCWVLIAICALIYAIAR